MFQVGIPYLRAKAKDFYEELGGGIDPDVMEDIADTRRIQALTDQVFAFRPYPYVFLSFDERTVRNGQIPTRVQESVSTIKCRP